MLRTYGDVTMFARSYGDGPPRVLWLHGWARRGEDFAACARAAAQAGVASLVLDLPGFGSSPPPTQPGGARHYAALVAPVLEQCADRPVIVGHSFGGRVATVLAATAPDRVGALVLSGVPLLRDTGAAPPPRGYRAVRWLHRRGVVSDARMEAARQKYGSTDYRRASGVVRDVLVASVNEDYRDELAGLRLPVALVWGERDDVVAPSMARRAADLIGPSARVTILAGVGHLVPTEAPEDLVRALGAVLA
ncbi:MAG: alpha/beta fold hydrolase [Acidimicrobiales bacterium]